MEKVLLHFSGTSKYYDGPIIKGVVFNNINFKFNIPDHEIILLV